MRKNLKKAASFLLSLCLLCSLFPVGGWSKAVKAAGNGTLQNGALTASTEGWTITEGWGEIQDGCLNLWNENAGLYAISQTIDHLAAGSYTAKAAIVGSGEQGASESKDNLNLTVKNNTTSAEKSVKLTTDGWNNWGNVVAAEAMEIAEGDSVTITIGGNLEAGEWYQIKNVVFEADTAVKDAPITVKKVDNLSEDFIHGVDVSMYLSEVQSGVKYYDENGQEQNLFQILKDKGVNWVRLRLWNCPFQVDENGGYKYVDEAGTVYKADQVTIKKPDVSPENAGEQKEWEEYFLADGTQVYRMGYGAGNCGIDTVTAIGKTATKYGLRVLVDFHYSDFWADPKKQSVPKAWQNMNLEQKTAALSAFTTESLNTLKAAGVDVGMVQIGNEINNGMAGEKDSANVYTLMKAGSAAVRAADPNIMIAVHYTDPQNEGYQMGKARELAEAGVDYDVFATSFYPFWHGTPQQLTANLKEIADTYNKKVMVAEVSYAWTMEDGDGYGNVVNESAADQTYHYPVNLEGQATAIRDTIAAVAAVGEKGIGTFYWEPAWVPVNVYKADEANADDILEANKRAWRLYGSGWGSIYGAEVDPEIKDDLNGGTWDNQAFFDFTGKALPSLNVYKWVYTGAEGPVGVFSVNPASCEVSYQTEPNLPKTVEVNLTDGSVTEAPVTWDQAQTAALKTAFFGDYTVNGTVGGFSYLSKGETIQVAAGTYQTTCSVRVVGKNYVKNGSFEENEGESAIGWTLINYLEDGAGFPKVKRGSSNAKSGSYHYEGWDPSGMDFALEQEIQEKLPEGYYALFAYYQGSGVEVIKPEAGVYAIVTNQDGTSKTYRADIQITNVWKDFYQAKVENIPVDSKVRSIQVGTRIACSGTSSTGVWVVVDDISLMRQGDLPSDPITPPGTDKPPVVSAYTVTFKDGDKVLSTQKVKPGESAAAPAAARTGYSLSWDKPFQKITGDLTVNAVWTANKYKITYDTNGGKKLKANIKTVTYDEEYGTLPTPKRSKYIFQGWYDAKSKGTKITSKTIVKITKDTTIYAHWKKVAKPAKVKKLTLKNSAKKTMQVSFKKVKGADGYQITYSAGKKFPKKSTKSVSVTKVKKAVKNLKKGKTYYVKVRAYKKDSTGKKIYGAYSSVKKVKIKK